MVQIAHIFIGISTEVTSRDDLSSSAKLVLALLTSLENRETPILNVASLCGLSLARTRRAIIELKLAGLTGGCHVTE